MDVEYDGEKVPPPSQIPWYLRPSQNCHPLTRLRYPDGLAWQFNVPKKVLRKQPEFKRFHSFLVYETDGVNLLHTSALKIYLLKLSSGQHFATRDR